MRALGQEPTDEEIQNLVQEVDRSGTGFLNFNDFLAFLSHISQVAYNTGFVFCRYARAIFRRKGKQMNSFYRTMAILCKTVFFLRGYGEVTRPPQHFNLLLLK